MRRVCLVANGGWYLYNFRLSLARGLQERGLEVVFVSGRDPFVEKLEAAGFRWREFRLNRASLSPTEAARSIAALSHVYLSERPDLVHHFTSPKCLFFGTAAARVARVPAIVNSVTGIRHEPVGRGLRARGMWAAERLLYRPALAHGPVQVIFQNRDDMAEMMSLGLVTRQRAHLVRGSGVDTNRYQPHLGTHNAIPRVLFASRLLISKGIYDLVDAARTLRSKGVPVQFVIAGAPNPGNPTSIPHHVLDEWRAEGIVELLGHVDPIDPEIALADLVVLPSYREGMPKILLEASAMAKPVITTDVQGCREAVDDGKTGLLVPPRDPVALAAALERLLRDTQLREAMGKAGRERVVREFSSERVIEETYGVYRSFELSRGA